MPMLYHCANEPYCPNYVSSFGKLCEDCKRREAAHQQARGSDKHSEGWISWFRKTKGEKKHSRSDE